MCFCSEHWPSSPNPLSPRLSELTSLQVSHLFFILIYLYVLFFSFVRTPLKSHSLDLKFYAVSSRLSLLIWNLNNISNVALTFSLSWRCSFSSSFITCSALITYTSVLLAPSPTEYTACTLPSLARLSVLCERTGSFCLCTPRVCYRTLPQ